MNKEGRTIHGLAEHARERGQFELSLMILDRAMIQYQKEGDLAGLAEALASRSLSLRHLADQTGEKAYLKLAAAEMRVAAEISPGAMPYYNLAKVEEDLGNLDEAVEAYRKAVGLMETNPPAEHNRPAVVSDMKIHLGVCELRKGEKAAEERIVAELSVLAGHDEVKYNKDVWMSGGWMSLAELTGKGEYLDKAKVIIDANPDLDLRREQWEKLSQKMK